MFWVGVMLWVLITIVCATHDAALDVDAMLKNVFEASCSPLAVKYVFIRL